MALMLLRLDHPNNWLAMDAEHATEATPVHVEAGMGRAPSRVPDWIWRRRGAYIMPKPKSAETVPPDTVTSTDVA
ncbi:MAG TPA: hypothetical protein VMB73_35960, partial [Acetobacteraceae bacterium]|nr:hypothetical protein [Acetobacteraceae bacterium]